MILFSFIFLFYFNLNMTFERCFETLKFFHEKNRNLSVLMNLRKELLTKGSIDIC